MSNNTQLAAVYSNTVIVYGKIANIFYAMQVWLTPTALSLSGITNSFCAIECYHTYMCLLVIPQHSAIPTTTMIATARAVAVDTAMVTA